MLRIGETIGELKGRTCANLSCRGFSDREGAASVVCDMDNHSTFNFTNGIEKFGFETKQADDSHHI